jgi:hypothetical protein
MARNPKEQNILRQYQQDAKDEEEECTEWKKRTPLT